MRSSFTTAPVSSSTRARSDALRSTKREPSSRRGTSTRKRGGNRLTSIQGGGYRDRHESRPEADGVVLHVLDNGVNRTPLQLQRYQSVTGIPGGCEGSLSDPMLSFMPSGLGMSGDGGVHVSRLLSNSLASYARRSSRVKSNSLSALEMSTQSVSFMDQSSHTLMGAGGHDAGSRSQSFADVHSSSLDGGGGVSLVLENFNRLMNKKKLLHEALLHHPGSPTAASGDLTGESRGCATTGMTEAQRRAWARARTTITLSETPTITLYTHQDEAVSSEQVDEVAAVRARKLAYAQLERDHQLDEGTRFQQRGTTTFAAPKKSTHSEIHPPEQRHAGALQVTPWMLRDAFEALLGDDEDDDVGSGGEMGS